MGRELRPPRPAWRREHPAQPRRRCERQVLLRPQEPLDHRQPELGHRGRRRGLPVRARLPGRLGPDCLRSWLEDPDGDGIYTFETTALPRAPTRRRSRSTRAGTRTTARAASRTARTSRSRSRPTTRRSPSATTRLDARADRHGRRPAGRARRALALRPRPQGLPRHRAQHDLEGLVHGRGRRAQRRLLPDDRQHERRDAPVRRHRRLDLHRPPDPRHDLHGRSRSTHGGHGLPRHDDGEERQVPDRDRLHHRPGHERAC